MKKKYFAIAILIISGTVWLVSYLSESNSNKPYITSFGQVVEIKDPLYNSLVRNSGLTDLGNIISPIDVALFDDRLIILSRNGDSVVTIVDPSNKKIIERVIGFGKGPKEVLTPWSLVKLYHSGDGFSVYDASLFRFVNYDLDTKTSSYSGITKLRKAGGRIIQPTWLNDSTIVATGFFELGRIAFFDSTGNLLKYSGAIPPGGEGVPKAVRQHAYQSSISVSPNGKNIVLATRHSDKIEIYNQNGKPKILIKGVKSFEPEYDVEYVRGTPTMSSGGNLRFGYIDIATTHNYIYGLFSGRFRSDGNANYGQKIHVFDWDGKLINALQLSHNTISINVGNSECILIALHPFSKEKISIYELNLEK